MIDVAIARFREEHYKNWVGWSVENRATVMSIAVAGFILVIGLLFGGRLGFSFFPQPEGSTITANIRFVAGTPEDKVMAFLREAERSIRRIEAEAGETILDLVVVKARENNRGSLGPQLGHIIVDLVPADRRQTGTADIVNAWRRSVPLPPGLEAFLIVGSESGPPGADIDVKFTGQSIEKLKAASFELQEVLRDMPGVSGVRDDTNYGREQLLFELSPTGTAVGLTEQELGNQLRVAFEGDVIQVFQDRGEEVEVRVRLADEQRRSLRTLETLPIVLPDGEITALSNVAKLSYNRGFENLRHSAGTLAISTMADVNFSQNNANAIRGRLARDVLPRLNEELGVSWSFGGDAAEQAESVGDISLALPLALISIFIILAWVFGSYLWPFAVISVIPFGLVGAIFGHWLLGFDVSMLSIFGFFGLSGIVLNDSIILVVAYQQARESGLSAAEAAVEAGCRRLRAVLLTSVTTIVGIMPLLLETDLQAQFLKPMVISIGFGLLFGTLIVLFLLPTLLVSLEAQRARFVSVSGDVAGRLKGAVPTLRAAVASGNPATLTSEDPAAPSKWSRS